MDATKSNRNWLGFWFMLPAMAFLVLFLAYPLGLGVWLSFTDAKHRPPRRVHRAGKLRVARGTTGCSGCRCSTHYSTPSSPAPSNSPSGLYLALLLNKNLPFKAMIRAAVLIPFIVPTVLSAIAFWWIYDTQFSIISWSLKKMGLITENIDFLGDPWNARWS